MDRLPTTGSAPPTHAMADMTDRPLIVISLEGLATSALSCYGSSWNQTPAIDAIAASGCVWDRCIATSDDPKTLWRQWTDHPASSWAACWRQRGSVELITDEACARDDFDQTCFDCIASIVPCQPSDSQSPAEDIVDSQFGQLVAAAIERDLQDEPWSVLWLHSSFLTRSWDAPRALFPIDEADEETREPSEEAELLPIPLDDGDDLERIRPIFDTLRPPQLGLDQYTHPDLVTSWMRTYGCQVRLLDLLIELLLNSLRRPDPYLALVGLSGFRLGQGGCIGHRPGSLRSPDIHLPLIVSDAGPLRMGHLASSEVLPSVLGQLGSCQDSPLMAADRWAGAGSQARVETQSEHAQFAVTTPEWFFVRDTDASQHLFLKPDDVEDFNDIGRIRQDVVRQLSDGS